MLTKLYCDKALEAHLERLRSGGGGGVEDGLLLGAAGRGNAGKACVRVAAFLPLRSGTSASAAGVAAVDAWLPGGMRVVGFYSFSASQHDHTERLAQLCQNDAVGAVMSAQTSLGSRSGVGSSPRRTTAVMMVHAANTLKCFLVTRGGGGGGNQHKPTEVQFQAGMAHEFRVFHAHVGPLHVRGRSRVAVGAAVRASLDARYARVTIDGAAVLPHALVSVTAGQVPRRGANAAHEVRFQVKRRRHPAAPPADSIVNEAVVLSGIIRGTAIAHVSDALLQMADSLVDSVVAVANRLVSLHPGRSSDGKGGLSNFVQEKVDEAMSNGFILDNTGGRSGSDCENIDKSGWASFAPASNAKSYTAPAHSVIARVDEEEKQGLSDAGSTADHGSAASSLPPKQVVHADAEQVALGDKSASSSTLPLLFFVTVAIVAVVVKVMLL